MEQKNEKYKIILGTILIIYSLVINVFASTVDLGIISGNDPSNPNADLSGLENFLLDNEYDVDLEFYAKVDFPSTTTTKGSGLLTLAYNMDDGESKSGEWFTDEEINLFSVKAGNQYALYWLDPAAKSGEWDTLLLDNKGISHLSTWKVIEKKPSFTNPEPGTMILLGFGLIGFAGVCRRKI